MKKYLLVMVLIVSVLFLVACNRTNIDDMIITPDELTATNLSDVNASQVAEVVDTPQEPVQMDEGKQTISLRDIDDFSVIINDPLIGKPSYGPDEEFDLNMVLSSAKFPFLDHIVLSFTPLCDKPSTLRVVVAGSLLAEEAFACDKNHEVVLPKSVLTEGFNTVLLQSKVKEDFYLDNVEITFQYTDRDAEVFEGTNFFFKKSSDSSTTTVQKFGDASLQNVVTKTFRLKESALIEPLYLGFDVSASGADVLVFLNGEFIPYEAKKGVVSVLLPKDLLVVGTNEVSFVAFTG